MQGVIGENGAFYFCYNRVLRQMERHYADSEQERLGKRSRLNALCNKIVAEVLGAAISEDQAYRETDLAIDIGEDASPLSDEQIDQIVHILREAGATGKIGSIHVDGWFGDYDKLSMTKVFAKNYLNVDVSHQSERFVFVGDSPNDESMFGFFPNSIGVANVRSFQSRLKTPPTYVTNAPGGEGFAEVAAALLAARTGGQA